MIQIYTGNGKGKTTAAIGLAFRALGHGKRVLMIQFMKKGGDMGEVKAARRFDKFEIIQAGRKGRIVKDTVSLKDRQLAEKGLTLALKALKSKKYELLILDELNVAVEFGLLKYQQVEETLKNRTESQEVIITGRYACPEILKIADLVSEVKELKHYYKNGITARAGIEY
jgi:cob(I)alamin adenosyltransferase